eukprot:2242979-Karenia_brevis.AAC.1
MGRGGQGKGKSNTWYGKSNGYQSFGGPYSMSTGFGNLAQTFDGCLGELSSLGRMCQIGSMLARNDNGSSPSVLGQNVTNVGANGVPDGKGPS